MASYRKRGCTCKKKHCTCGATWEFRISVIDPATGKRNQPGESGFTTKKEAELAASEMELRYKKGNLSPSHRGETLGSFMKNFLEKVLINNVGENTYEQKHAHMELYVIPKLGRIKLEQLTPLHMHEFINYLTSKNIGAGGIQNIMRLISQTLNKALEWGYVTKNVAQMATKPRYKSEKMSIWTKEQFQYFLENTKNSRLFPFYLIGLNAGMRPGEITALSWDYVNFRNSTIKVARTAVWTKKKGLHIKESTKNDSSNRTIAVANSVMSYLKKLKMSQETNELNLVIPGIRHPIVYNSVINKIMAQDIESLGLPSIRPHDLRHTHATYLLSPKPFGLGQNLKLVSERLGHANASTTLNTYSHVLPNMQEFVADLIDDHMKGILQSGQTVGN